MRFEPIYRPVWHEIGDRLAIAADDDGLAVPFQLGEQAGEMSLGFVNIHCFHDLEKLVHLVHAVNRGTTRDTVHRDLPVVDRAQPLDDYFAHTL